MFSYLSTHTPKSVAELCEKVCELTSTRQAIAPSGNGTLQHIGGNFRQAVHQIRLTELNQVIDYPARDMTITVGAGITLKKLNEILLTEGQQLAVDCPLPEMTTMGGAIAVNTSGPRRFGLGTLRDYLIGISFVNNLGEVASAGGRVVKNVAGYDLMKLMTGSLGTLGIITQVTLKLKPIPEAKAAMIVPLSKMQLPALMELLNKTQTRPVVQQWWNAPTAETMIAFEDNRPAVEWSISTIAKELQGAGFNSFVHLDSNEYQNKLQNLTNFSYSADHPMTWKAVFRPSRTVAFCQHLLEKYEGALNVHLGNGIVFGWLNGQENDAHCRLVHTELVQKVHQHGGMFTVLQHPPSIAESLELWGDGGAERVLMKNIKLHLDPASTFNPGRFVDGI
ncbi:MAG: FAD-binding oxidoreductase [Zavarzinella sp.]